ncbi:S-layer homology domain-containing protein [Candidatus Peregrinibacteria bacterium]|nr:S-layer homology domain-containing protein [Candidatus Peregrinibacteria bacterium]
MANPEFSAQSTNAKKVVLGIVVLLILGAAAYFLATSEFFKGQLIRLRQEYDQEMFRVRKSVTVRKDCGDFCTWPIEAKKETSFNVRENSVFSVLPKSDGAPSGKLRMLKADFEIRKQESNNNYWPVDKSIAAGTTIVEWCIGKYATSNDEITESNQCYDSSGSFETEQFAVQTAYDQLIQVEYTVSDSAGRSDSVTKTITIPATEPYVKATCTIQPSQSTDQYIFTARLATENDESFEYDPSNYSWYWKFGDGQVWQGGESISHTFISGTYSPTVTVTDVNNVRIIGQCEEITVTPQPAEPQPGGQLRTRPSSASDSFAANTLKATGTLDENSLGAPKEMGNLTNINSTTEKTERNIVPEESLAIDEAALAAEFQRIRTEVQLAIGNEGLFIAPAGSTVYFEAYCPDADKALLIQLIQPMASIQVQEQIPNLPSQPAATNSGAGLMINLKKINTSGGVQPEWGTGNNVPTGTYLPLRATLGIKSNPSVCGEPVIPTGEHVPPVTPEPIIPACKLDPDTIYNGERVIFSGRDSSGPYTDARLDFGAGTILNLNVPAAAAKPAVNTRTKARASGSANFRLPKAPMESSLGREREIPPSVKLDAALVDEVQKLQTHTYDLQGTYTVTLTLSDAENQPYTCSETVEVVDPPVVPAVTQCSDSIDNDDDGFVDFVMAATANDVVGDPGCDDYRDNDETNADEPVVVDPVPPSLPFCLAYTTPQKYSDVSTKDHAYDVIKEESSTAYNGDYADFVGEAIFHGYPDDDKNKRVFRPDQAILRSEAAKIIMHATCYADALLKYDLLDDSEVGFDDVEDHWANQIINIMANAGIFDKKKENNEPDSHTTRAEFIKMLTEVHLQTIGEELNAFRENDHPFVDVAADDWFAPYVQTAVDFGIAIESEDFKFRPNRIVTREDAAVWIYNYFQAVADATFKEKRQGEINTDEE